MLKRIRCNKFAPPYQDITLNADLNIILGDDIGSSAIGKTAFLNVIDYVFGGDAYYSGDIQKNVGLHTIFFEFEFGEEHLYFCRETGNTLSVFLCDDQWHYREEIDLPQYRRMLSEQYGCLSGHYDLPAVMAHFFRIYGHGNTLETAPYRCSIHEDDKKAIDFLMSIFGYAGVNTAITEKAKELGVRLSQLEKKSETQDAQDEQTFADNLQKIESLTERYTTLMSDSEDYQFGYLGFSASQSDPVSEKLNKLREEVRKLTDARDGFQAQIDSIKGVQDTDVTTLTTEFTGLKRFFPDVNISALADIETFHKRIREILQQEAQEQICEIQKLIDRYDTEIRSLKNRIHQTGLPRKMAVTTVSQCVEIKMQIERLQAENVEIEDRIQRRKERREAEQELAQLLKKRADAIENLQAAMNAEMKHLFDAVTGKQETSAPVLTISTDKAAAFEIPGNTSEGAAFKGLVIYDLAILNLCRNCTPALIHDSNILSRIEADNLAPILQQYKECGYQVFISFDKSKKASPEAQRILFESPVLQLAAGNGRELYGRSWSKVAVEDTPTTGESDKHKPAEGEENYGKNS
jgi:hypothetical protein